MPDHLRLTINFEEDGTAELHAKVQANGFLGKSSAWLNPESIMDFANRLAAAFPLHEPLELRGGYWGTRPGEGLSQEHLSLRFYPVEGRGVLGCQVRLATPLREHERIELQHAVRAELLTSYQELQSFSVALIKLAQGTDDVAVLNAVAV